MAISTNGLQLVRLAGAVFNQQLSAADYAETLAANKTAADLSAWANSAVALEFKGKTTTDIAKAVLANVGLTSVTGLEAWLAGQLTAGGGVAKAGETMLSLLNDFSNMSTSDATYGAAVMTFNTKSAASQVLSQTAGTATGTYAAVSSVVVNTALTLTSAVQTSTGTAGDDTFTAAAGTLNAGDVVNGGAGNDTLNATITGTAPTQSATSLVSIETLNLTASPNPATLDLTGVTGLTQVNNLNPANGASLAVSGLGNVVNTTITGGNTSTSIAYTTAATAGLTDAATLSLRGAAAGSSFTTSGVETLTINSGTSANTLTSLSAVGMTRLNITGDQALTILGTVGNSGTTTPTTTYDASAATGAVTLTQTGSGLGTSGAGVTVTGPTAATAGAFTVTTGSNNDTVTLGAGTNTVDTGSGNDVITSGGGANTITPGAGNDTVNLGAGVDTVRLADVGATNADTLNNFGTTDVVSVNIGAAAVTGASAAPATASTAFGVVPTGATSPVLQNVAGSATTNSIVFQTIAPNATATVGTVAGTSNVIALNGVYTDGTAAGVISALGTSATTGIATATNGKFLLVTYSVGNIAQVWSFGGDGVGPTGGNQAADSDITSSELSLVATLNGVALNGLTAANFSTYLTPVAASTTISNAGQTINLTGTANTVLSTANAAGQFLTGGADTINVGVGTLPLNTASSTSALTLIDPTAGDADVLNATNLSATSFSGGATLISNIETINLNMLVANTTFSAAAVTPGTTTFGLTGTANFVVTGMPNAGGVTLGSGYTGQANYQLVSAAGAADTFTVNLNGSTATSDSVGASAIYTANGLGNIETTTVNVNAASSIRVAGAGVFGTVAESPTINLAGTGSLTVFGTAANLNTAALAGGRDAYTGALTLRPSTDASMDFSASGVITGIRTIDLQDIPAYGTAQANTITFSATNTTNGILSATISNAPATGTALTQGAITVAIPNGGSTSDAVTFSSNSRVTTIGAIDARGIESVTVSTSVASGSTFSIGDIQLTNGAGSQTVTVTGAANIGGTSTITADTVNFSGVTGSVTGVTLANTGGVAFTGGSGATTVIGSANADLFTTAANSVNTNTITPAAGNDVINLGANHTGVVKIVFSGSTTNALTLAANGQDYITGFATTDTLNIAALGDGTTPTAGLVTGAAIALTANKTALTDDTILILNSTGAAGNLTGDGTAVITDWTNMTQVGAYLSERYTTTNDADQENVIVWNVGRTSYIYNLDSLAGGTTAIAAAEISLVAVVVQTAALVAANLVAA